MNGFLNGGGECGAEKGEEGEPDRGDKKCRSRSSDERPQCGNTGEGES